MDDNHTTVAAEIRRALAALEAGEAGPNPDELAAAPVLNDWRIILMRRSICLAGTVDGHPYRCIRAGFWLVRLSCGARFRRSLADHAGRGAGALPLLIKGSRTQATSLHRTGVLKAIINRDLEEGIGRIDFSQREVAQFLAKIETLEMACPETETVDLTTATKRTGFSTGQIMGAIFSGHLLAFRSSGDVGLNVVRISAESLLNMKGKCRVSS